MFLGHYGLAFAAKRVAPRASLGALTFAAQFLDELWPILLLLGVEHVEIVPGLMAASALNFTYYPISHSLLMAIIWGGLIGGVYVLLRRYGRGAYVMAALVVSHWFLDLPMHRPDLPLVPGSGPKFGWGLWNSLTITLIIELTIYLAGVSSYLRSTRARDGIGRWGAWVFVVTLPLIFLSSNGAPPPSERALALSALALWLFVPWSYWIDKHRQPIVRAVDP